jgi:hypothetical protein
MVARINTEKILNYRVERLEAKASPSTVNGEPYGASSHAVIEPPVEAEKISSLRDGMVRRSWTSACPGVRCVTQPRFLYYSMIFGVRRSGNRMHRGFPRRGKKISGNATDRISLGRTLSTRTI